MGTLTIGRKRSHDFDSLNCKTPALSSHFLKKTRFFTSSNQVHNSPRQEPRALISRYRQYPDPKPQCKREPLAPVRQARFGSYLNSKRRDKFSLPSGMGNILGCLKQTREAPSKSLRFDEKDEVIEIEDDRVFDSNDDEVVEVVNLEEKEPSGNSGVGEDDMVVDEKNHDWNHRGNVKDVEELEMLDGKAVNRHYGSSSSSVMTNVSNGDLRAQSTEKTQPELIRLDEESGNMELNAYKDLVNEVDRKFQHLEHMQFQIDFTEKKLQALQQSRPRIKVEVEVEVEAEAEAEALVDAFRKEMVAEAFTPLTQDEEKQVTDAFSNPKRRMVLVTHQSSNIDITGELLRCLRPGMWLNDEVINLYLELLKEREKRDPKKYLKCHFFNTFFYKKVTSGNGYNFQSVRRWTTQKKLGYCLFDCDKIFIPIHKNIHWCLAIINKKEQKFQYLDSLGGVDSHVLKILAKYFVDEVKEKSGKDIDVSSWTQENIEDLPEQMNGFDCGVFMIKYADFYSRDIGLCFNQEHMPYFRLRTAKEILQLKAD